MNQNFMFVIDMLGEIQKENKMLYEFEIGFTDDENLDRCETFYVVARNALVAIRMARQELLNDYPEWQVNLMLVSKVILKKAVIV